MILEIATIHVKPGQGKLFEAIFPEAEKVIAASPGYISHELRRSVENSGKYILLVRWESLEAHLVGFRESPRFLKWRGLIGGFFQGPPEVEHFEPTTDQML
jgi:heme-degrading monooxygenase HmoA